MGPNNFNSLSPISISTAAALTSTSLDDFHDCSNTGTISNDWYDEVPNKWDFDKKWIAGVNNGSKNLSPYRTYFRREKNKAARNSRKKNRK